MKDTEVDECKEGCSTVDSDYLPEQEGKGGHRGLLLGVEGLNDHHRLVGKKEYDCGSCTG